VLLQGIIDCLRSSSDEPLSQCVIGAKLLFFASYMNSEAFFAQLSLNINEEAS